MKKFLCLLALISAVTCNQFIVLNSPKSIDFKGSSPLDSLYLSEVISATLGFTASGSNWDGVYIKDPFNVAHGSISIVVEGTEEFSFKNAKSYRLEGNSNFDESLKKKVQKHGHLMIDADFTNAESQVSTEIGEIVPEVDFESAKFLKPKYNKYDADFYDQIAYLRGLIDLLENSKTLPSVVVAQVSLKMLENDREKSSPAYMEAKKILANTIEDMNAVIAKIYDGNYVFTVIAVENQLNKRSKRQTTVESNDKEKYNLADFNDEDYPVMFNIIFWFSIIFIFTLLAISLAISNMEDKDSIIYRMTSKNKKEN